MPRVPAVAQRQSTLNALIAKPTAAQAAIGLVSLEAPRERRRISA